MKKLFVAVALVMSLGTTVAFANTCMNEIVASVMVNEFTPIEVKDIPQAVQDAIAKTYAETTIKEAAVEVKAEGTKAYKIVLTDKNNNESTVFFNEDGSEIKTN